MPVRAVWHSELVVDADDDPFADPPQRIEDVGTPIVIGTAGDEAQLQRELITTLAAEGRLDADGTRCSVKDAHDTSCYACPLYRDDGSAAAQLCEIGRQQARICTEIAVIRHGGRRH